jgi:UPF0716 family protein affecting phage T7 exclusion
MTGQPLKMSPGFFPTLIGHLIIIAQSRAAACIDKSVIVFEHNYFPMDMEMAR